MTPFETMQRFHKVAPSRKDVYKKMQRAYLAGESKKGLFTDSEIVIASDSQYIFQDFLKGLLNSGYIESWHNEERAKRQVARNLEFGTRLFGTWRNTAGVYRIDEQIAPQAMASSIPFNAPSDIYKQLPEWCVYVEVPQCEKIQILSRDYTDQNNQDTTSETLSQILGFWALHDEVTVKGKKMLCLDIFMHVDHHPDVQLKDFLLVPTRILMSPDLTIMDSLRMGYPDATEEQLSQMPTRKALLLLLWLCVEKPDITNMVGEPMNREDIRKPRYGQNKKTGAFIPPVQETYFDLAKRMGGEIREHKKKIAQFNDEHASPAAKRKIPHIRIGHWTGVWIGNGSNKSFKPYWQPPLFINARYL